MTVTKAPSGDAAALAACVRAACAELRAQADPVAAPIRKRYLKTPFEVLGCKVPVVNAAARAVRRAHPKPARGDVLRVLGDLFGSAVHDDKLLAIVLAGLYQKLFLPDDIGDVLLGWLRSCHGWDHVDAIATRVVGEIACRHPDRWAEIAGWSDDHHMWVRRASVLAHITAVRRGGLQADRLAASCRKLAGEEEFFIRKAIGWTLREVGRKDPDLAERLIVDLGGGLAKLSLREATRRLDPARRARISAAIGGSGRR